MNCPLCNSRVLYVGLNQIECAGEACANQARDLPPLITMVHGVRIGGRYARPGGKPMLIATVDEYSPLSQLFRMTWRRLTGEIAIANEWEACTILKELQPYDGPATEHGP